MLHPVAILRKVGRALGMVGAMLLATFALLWAAPAAALPSFAQQTGQSCSQCHVGAYGPQLKAYGRDFKLYGYVNGDGRNTLPPIAAILSESFTHTQADRTPLVHYDRNDNLAFTSGLLAYAGRLGFGAGAFAEASFDPMHRKWSWAKVDVRRAWDHDVKGKDLLVGVEVNNRPGLGDLWNSTPVFEFNAATSVFAGSPSNAAYVDGKLGGRTLGAGLYAMWDNTFYGEFNAYLPLDNDTARRLGVTLAGTADRYAGAAPYWRVAAQRTFGDAHYWELGAYGLYAQRYPGGVSTAGKDSFTDTALDATYQYVGSKKHFVASHLTWIHEDADLAASHSLTGANASNHLDTVRLDTLYSYANTWTPAVEMFQTTGSSDAKYFRTSTGVPDSNGYVLELSYTPWGKPGSLIGWGNMKLAARYVGYGKFNGTRTGATNNNTVFVSATFALAPFGALVQR